MTKATIAQMVDDVMEGLKVLQRNGGATIDGEPISDAVLLDRARNIVSGLIGNYRFESWATLEGESVETKIEAHRMVHG